jgi:hypothetical protein
MKQTFQTTQKTRLQRVQDSLTTELQMADRLDFSRRQISQLGVNGPVKTWQLKL